MREEFSIGPKKRSKFEEDLERKLREEVSRNADFWGERRKKNQQKNIIASRDPGDECDAAPKKVSDPYGDECDSVKPRRLNSKL